MARDYKKGTLAERLAKKADSELEISRNAAALFAFLKPEYERWNNAKVSPRNVNNPNFPINTPEGGPINSYVLRTAVDNMVSSEKDLAFSEDLREASDLIGVVQAMRENEELKAAAQRLKGKLEGTFRYKVYRGATPEGVPSSAKDQALILLSLAVLGVH